MIRTILRWSWRFAVFLLLSIIVTGLCVMIVLLIDDFV